MRMDNEEQISFIGDGHYLDSITVMNWIKKNKMLSFNIMKLKEGDMILDIGCGTGEDVLILSKMVGNTGKVVGIDIDEKMIDEARSKSQEISNVEFNIGDIYNLDFDDNTFDGTRADRVFQHLSEPEKALAEMVRVIKPNSPIVIMDPDWESLKIDSPSIEFTNNFLAFHNETFANSASGKTLANQFRRQKLKDIQVIADTLLMTNYDEMNQVLMLEKYVEIAIEKKIFKESEIYAWIQELKDLSKKKLLFVYLVGFGVLGYKP